MAILYNLISCRWNEYGVKASSHLQGRSLKFWYEDHDTAVMNAAWKPRWGLHQDTWPVTRCRRPCPSVWFTPPLTMQGTTMRRNLETWWMRYCRSVAVRLRQRAFLRCTTRWGTVVTACTTCFNVQNLRILHTKVHLCRSEWQRGLRHEISSPAQALGSWVRIPLGVWMCLCCPV
jgi:hypothetical protein